MILAYSHATQRSEEAGRQRTHIQTEVPATEKAPFFTKKNLNKTKTKHFFSYHLEQRVPTVDSIRCLNKSLSLSQNTSFKENEVIYQSATIKIHPHTKQHCPRVLDAGKGLSSLHLVSLLQKLKHTLMFYSLFRNMLIIF